MNKNFLYGVIIGALLATLGSVGTADYLQAKKDEASYCKNVKNKTWPDYKKIFEKTC